MKTTFLVKILDDKSSLSLAHLVSGENHTIKLNPISSPKTIRILEKKSFMLTCNINSNKLIINFSLIISIDGIPWAKNDIKKNNQNEVDPPIGNLYEIIKGEYKGCMLLCFEEIKNNDDIEIQ